MAKNVEAAAGLLKALAHPSRLRVVCHLANGEATVGELNAAIPMSQSALSQHLAVLRRQNLVETRRDSQRVFYRLSDDTAMDVLGVLHQRFRGKAG